MLLLTESQTSTGPKRFYLAVPLAQLPTLIDYLCEVSSPGEFSPDRATEKPTSRYAGGMPTAASSRACWDGVRAEATSPPIGRGRRWVVRLAELIVILELHQQGMTVSAIARRTGLHRSTVAKYLARGIEPPAYGPRSPRPTKLTPFERYLRERIAAVPELTGSRLYREIRELGSGGYTVLKDFLRQVRPRAATGFEVRFETPAGRQAQVDFAHFRTVFTDEPGVERIVWLFSFVLGHSRMMWGRYVLHQDMQTLLRCHAEAFAALGGVRRKSSTTACAPCSAATTSKAVTSSTMPRCAHSPRTTATSQKPAVPIAPKRKAKWSGHSATCARTSF